MEKRTKFGFGRKAALASIVALSGMAMSACTVTPPDAIFNILHMGMPRGITPEAHEISNMYVWVWVTAWTIGIIMWAIFFTAIFAWGAKKAEKKGKGEFPKQLQYNIPLELVLTAIPIVIVMGLFLFTVQAQDRATAMNKDPKVTVDVTAFQWNWKFGYQKVAAELNGGADYDGVDQVATAKAEASKTNANNYNPIHGRSETDQTYLHFNKIETVGSSDEIPVLVLPSNTAIEFQLASADVSHAFWVPEFLFKRDAYNHPEDNQQNRSFQIEKIEKEGAFVGRCAEMCGTYHAMMNFEVRVVSPEKFEQYLKFRQDNPEATNAEALKSIGEEPYATSTKPFVSDRLGTRTGDNFVDHNQAV